MSVKKRTVRLVLNDFEKLFEDCLNEWIENNLSRIVKENLIHLLKKWLQIN